ncbi:MAG: hypothetical protein P8168_01850 [Deltaproteobacteria bacterium]
MGMALQGRGLAQAARRRMYVQKVILVLLTMGVLAGLAYFLLHEKQTKEQSGGVSAAKESARPKAMMDFEILKGRWVRPDGGYVVAVREIDASGRMVAAYFNPRPINVSQAAASSDGTTIKVFIELRDINYPGATYNLTYDPRSDQLRGIYFQPAINQSFYVVFVRMK